MRMFLLPKMKRTRHLYKLNELKTKKATQIELVWGKYEDLKKPHIILWPNQVHVLVLKW